VRTTTENGALTTFRVVGSATGGIADRLEAMLLASGPAKDLPHGGLTDAYYWEGELYLAFANLAVTYYAVEVLNGWDLHVVQATPAAPLVPAA
jgi:hypothetical protein